jgi:nicotine blue oxidoreductase
LSGISAILLAAGAGSRFGGGKLTAIFDGKPLISHPLEALRDASVDETVVVVGADAARLREICEPCGVRVVENPDWEQGQSTSVRVGIEAMTSEARAAVILLGDQPLVTAGAVAKLVEAFEDGAEVAVATYEGRRRNPVLFARSVWTKLVDELSGDEGARSFLRKHPKLVVEVACDEVGNPADVDTEEDLRRVEGMRESSQDYKMG